MNLVVTSRAHLEVFAKLKFSRLSMGVQDFDAYVQEAINRHQTYEQTQSLILSARELGLRQINVDLVYGLPKQKLASFQETILKVLQLQPNRVALCSYAQVP